VFDDSLQDAIEPGTPTAAARLATVRAVRDAGMDCSVFMMPVLPYLTDSKAHLDAALAQISESGATSVLYTALHLRPGTKQWFMQWIAREHPELEEKYRYMYYGQNSYAPKDYRRWLAQRIKPLIARHGLRRGQEDPTTGGVRTTALGRRRDSDGELVNAPTRRSVSLLAEELPPTSALALF
jgi:DNA repair photolyase